MKRTIYVLLIMMVLIVGFSHGAQAQESVPRFESTECPIEVPPDRSIECGNLITLEDYDNQQSRTIQTAVLIIHSLNPNSANEAMLFTEGGPGFSSLNSVWWLSGTPFGNDRDIIIIEQRGNKFSEPRLDCDFSVWWEETEEHTPCLDSLQLREIPLEYYTTASIAADVNTLKQVLEYQSWILYGSSYSTRLMQLVMDRYPEDIRAVVMHSISPITEARFQHDPEHSIRVLKVVFDDCVNQPACAESYPDLENNFYDLVRELNDNPVEFEMDFPDAEGKFMFEVNGHTLVNFMIEDAFYGPSYPNFQTAYLPLLINEVYSGKSDLLYPWAERYVSRWGNEGFSWGLYFSINCQEEAPYTNSAMLNAQINAVPELDGFSRTWDELTICNAWNLDAAPPLAVEPVASDIPVLVLAGTYDPVTPPEWSRIALENLSNHTFVEFPSSGHSVPTDNPCSEQITVDFLDNPKIEPDLSCLGDRPAPKFVLPDEIIISPSIYEIHYREIGYSKLEENFFLGSWLTLIGSGTIALILGLVKLIRRDKKQGTDIWGWIALLVVIATGITSTVWGFQLRSSLQSTAATSANALRFGLPVEYKWLFLIIPFIGLMTLSLIVLAGYAWKRKYWSLIGRLAFTGSTLGAVTFSSLLAYWGLFTSLFH